jgi:hypothetical protein
MIAKRNLGILLLMITAILALPSATVAHEIPVDVTIHIFLKPEGQRLRMIVRVPMAALRDIDYPKRGGEAYLDIGREEPSLRTAAMLWIENNTKIFEDGRLLPTPALASVRASINSDRSIATYEEALAHLMAPPLPPETEFNWMQGLLDILFEYPIQSDRAKFSINPEYARLGIHTMTIVRFMPPDGSVRALQFSGDPGLVHLDPSWMQAAGTFVKLGFEHILDGTDHLLFLFCLVIPFRKFRQLVMVVTAFTVAHSVTLIASAYDMAPGMLWFPPLVETLIAMSILYMALENIVGSNVHRRWIITFAFGLIHGFGFSFALRETLQFAGSYMLTSLLAFNVGVELGQLLVLALLIPALELFFRRAVQERIGTIILSAIVAHTAWHWMTERWSVLRQFEIQMPEFNTALVVLLIRWAMIILVLGGLAWGVSLIVKRRDSRLQSS